MITEGKKGKKNSCVTSTTAPKQTQSKEYHLVPWERKGATSERGDGENMFGD